MTGPEPYRRAGELAAEARKLLGQGEGQDTGVAWAAVAPVHASLALAAATALGSSFEWNDVAATKLSGP